MIHGLGFITGLVANLPGSQPSSIFPGLTFALNTTSINGIPTSVNSIFPPLIFDRYVTTHPEGIPLSSLFNSLINGLDQPMSYSSWMKAFQNSTAFTTTQTLYTLATTPNRLRFQFPGTSGTSPSDYILLHTSYPKFKTGSSLSHCDQTTYSNNPDFLMRPEASPGVILSTLSFGSQNFPIGPSTIKMLSAIGYSVNPQRYSNGATGLAILINWSVSVAVTCLCISIAIFQ